MRLLHGIFLLVLTLFYSHAKDPEKKIFCHWDIDSYNRTHSSSFTLSYLSPQLCPTIVLGAGASIDLNNTGELRVVNEVLLFKLGLLTELSYLKRRNIQTILSFGGWKGHEKSFSDMASDEDKREKFLLTLLKFLIRWDFNGVLIDWEFPMPEDRENFVILLKELQIVLEEYHLKLMVVASARLDEQTIKSYDITQIARYVDYIVLNTHHPRDPYSRRLEYNAPLRGNGSRSVERSIESWVKISMTPQKLILGLPIYAQTYTLEDMENTNVGAESRGPGRQHRYSRRPGYMTVGEFCEQSAKWTKKFDKLAAVPYAYKDDQWASYENGRSFSAKLHFAKDKGLGGAMAWSVDADDFNGKCGEFNGLLRVIMSILGDLNTLTTTPAPVDEGYGLCPKDGFFRHMWDCRLYYECRAGERIDYECLEEEYFEVKLAQCQPKEKVKCNQNFVVWRPGDATYNFKNMPLNLKIVNH